MNVAACFAAIAPWGAALFAQEAAPKAAPPPAGGLGMMLPAMIGVMVLFYFMIIRPQRREQDSRQTMLGTLKKSDRVVTVGGLYGVVSNVRPENDEVTLTVDESNNTKIRVTLQSIQRKLGEDPEGEAKKAK